MAQGTAGALSVLATHKKGEKGTMSKSDLDALFKKILAWEPAERERDPNECRHPKTTPAYDPTAAKGLEASEIQRRWPRFYGRCPDCGASVIGYASYEHYIMGDW